VNRDQVQRRPADLNRFLQSPLFASTTGVGNQLLRTIYFDTSDGDLRKEGIALRIRKPGRNAAVLGVKAKLATGEGPFSRTEI
jgi:inorganic triphosphatase YgiF